LLLALVQPVIRQLPHLRKRGKMVDC
jgi:hypothetical protein